MATVDCYLRKTPRYDNMAYNKGFNPDRLPAHAEPEQVRSSLVAQEAYYILSKKSDVNMIPRPQP